MRDFDDVTENLKSIRDISGLASNVGSQRLYDLRAAGLVMTSGSLSALGSATLKSWEAFGIGSDNQGDELARVLIILFEAKKSNALPYEAYFDYWSELRQIFNPYDLILNWDALFALNHLDYSRNGFFPGMVYRESPLTVGDIAFDLGDYARNTGLSAKAAKGAAKIETTIAGKIPRGRHRATFCMALEILASSKVSKTILDQFGVPRKPRSWTPFNADQRAKIELIVSSYVSFPVVSAGAIATAFPPLPPALSLPQDIDFADVLVPQPLAAAKLVSSGPSKGLKKADYMTKAARDAQVGTLGEEFAVAFERWRLRHHPALAARIRHVSLEDDTLGYDILSFEQDGNERFVEVKSTLGDLSSRFFISSNELAIAKEKGARYVLLRVGNLGTAPKCCETRFPFDGRLELTASSYSVTYATKAGED